MSSYAAYQQYPYQVSRLQEIEPKLTGGCTAVLAIIVNERLYVANAGDSRAVLVFEGRDGTLSAKQLSVDHSVENEDELKRLESLGLDPKVLIKCGRLGMQENTRSIGDYSIKQGYRDVDTLRSATINFNSATDTLGPVNLSFTTGKWDLDLFGGCPLSACYIAALILIIHLLLVFFVWRFSFSTITFPFVSLL